jgi:KAP family P-loop domain
LAPQVDLGIKLDLTFSEPTVEKAKERIDDHVARYGLNLVVMIDDLDRLRGDEILATLRLARASARFRRTTFILSLDYEATVGALQSSFENRAAEYLEKIVQIPLSLPRVNHEEIDKFLFYSDHDIPDWSVSQVLTAELSGEPASTWGVVGELSRTSLMLRDPQNGRTMKVNLIHGAPLSAAFALGSKVYVKGLVNLDNLEVKDPSDLRGFRLSAIDDLFMKHIADGKLAVADVHEFNESFEQLYRLSLSKLVDHLRDAKRYINALSATLPLVASEVNLQDFCLLEFIRVFFPDLYADIFDNWWYYVDQRYRDDLGNPFLFSSDNDRAEARNRRRKHIEDAVAKSAKQGLLRTSCWTFLKSFSRRS